MILIITSSLDRSSSDVIKWLKKFNQKYLRINDTYRNKFIENYISEQELDEIKSVWFRRTPSTSITKFDSEVFNDEIQRSLKEEITTVNNYFYFKLEKKKWINHPLKGNLNKLITNSLALDLGLNVPETLITDSKSNLIKFIEKHGKVISKPIANIKPASYLKKRFVPYTKIVTEEYLKSVPDFFFTSLFQKCIDKSFEIRIFFLEDEFYSMAIMSQNNKMTLEDFRNYDYDNPNRFVPYKVPDDVTKKLKSLISKLDLPSGSIDLIKGTDGQFYFLEINPVGQFGMTSYPCNYNLEKKVALKLISYERNNG